MTSIPTPSCETDCSAEIVLEEIKEEDFDSNVVYDGLLNPETVILDVKDELLMKEEIGNECEKDTDCKEEPECKEEPDCKEETDCKEESYIKTYLSGDEDKNEVDGLTNVGLSAEPSDRDGTEEGLLVKFESCTFPEICDCAKCEPTLDSDGEIMDVENSEPQVPITQNETGVPKMGKPKKKKKYYPGSKLFKCDNCDYKCYQLAHMEYHRSIHTGEKPLACKHCDYRARHPTTLTRHIRSQHTGEKPYSCEFCDYRAAQPASMHRHRRTHTGERPYGCKLCDYTSPDLNTVQLHELRHSGGTLRKLLNPRKCYLCDFSTSRRRGLVRHLLREHPGEPPLPYLKYYPGPLKTSTSVEKYVGSRKGQIRSKNCKGEWFPGMESLSSGPESDSESEDAVEVESDSNVDVDEWALPDASSSGRRIKTPKRLDL
ncbi:hypothetical protein GE061_018111 [Apolygus lucorum]|uniref:C2H2-type domain-containing protein n=1 Tax=Apolygus lucorum TaxID=248454 RepID=A0A6A4IV85_APOLU|nr:hypothetical protein GE061_018111 [Apolygus lucorum]